MINELQNYYNELQTQLKAYLENQLRLFKDENNRYLSQVVAEACENAKNLLETSNQKAFERFEQAKSDLENKRKENYPETLLVHMAKSAKTDLESSLKFNQSLFESSILYYKELLS